MKKLLLLSCCLMLSYTFIQAQIIVYCQSPASVQGNKAFTWADPTGGWGTKNLNIPANSVTDTLMVVDDGGTGDSLGCNPLINDLTGKIALVYRGSCEFGAKAKHAQDAGAVGVIIINNAAGAPIAMGPGASGAADTIPVVMVSNTDGAALRAAVDAGGNVVVFIGNKFGLYSNDLGLYAVDAYTSRVTANPALISASAAEFSVPMGGWVHNYGTSTQTNVTLNATISGAATYTAASAPIASLAQGDSAYVTIPTYSAASYSGLYKVKYTINYGNADGFTADNSFLSGFLIDSLFSYAYIDTMTQRPVSSANLKDNSTAHPTVPYLTCVHFRDPHASRLAALGIYASAGTLSTYNSGNGLDGETIESLVYEWNNTFTGLSDPAFPATSSAWNLNQVGSGSYTYSSNLQSQMVYIPFSAPVTLVDNKRYLFCNRTFNPEVELGYDTHFNYLTGIDSTDQPISIAMIDTANFATGFGTDQTSAVTVKFGPYDMGVNEINKSFDVTPFPNPTSNFIHIPLKGMNGIAQLKIMDMTGKLVNEQSVKVNGDVSVNVTDVPNGNYIFNMMFKDGSNTTFKVVVTK